MNTRSTILLIALALATMTGIATADITVTHSNREAAVYIAACDSNLILAHDVEWGPPEGEFSSDLSVVLLNTVSASQHSTLSIEGNDLQIAGSGSCRIVRTETGGCERAQTSTQIGIQFSTSESSILSIDNHGFFATGDYSGALFSLRDFATGQPIFTQDIGDYAGEIQLEAGVEYFVVLSVSSIAAGDEPVDTSASFEFDISIAPGVVALDELSWSSVKALFH